MVRQVTFQTADKIMEVILVKMLTMSILLMETPISIDSSNDNRWNWKYGVRLHWKDNILYWCWITYWCCNQALDVTTVLDLSNNDHKITVSGISTGCERRNRGHSHSLKLLILESQQLV